MLLLRDGCRETGGCKRMLDFKMERRDSRSRRHCGSPKVMENCILKVLFLLLLTGPSLQDEYIFEKQPERYIYQIVGKAIFIPCEVILQRDDGTTQYVNPTLLLDSKPVDIYARNTRYYSWLNINGTIAGLLVTPAQLEDTGKVVECAVLDGNITLALVRTVIYVGDGRPLAPVTNLVQTAESLYSVVVNWGETPHPTRYPLQGYTLMLRELLEIEREITHNTFSNDTNAEITGLKPGVEYQVVVFGRNQHGEGQRLPYIVVRTSSPVVPLPPTSVKVILEKLNKSSNIILSWTPTPIEPDIMTPISEYIVFYGLEPTNRINITISNSSDSQYIISGLTEGGTYSVGVASVNSAGLSEIAFAPSTLEVPDFAKSIDPIQLETIIISVVAVVVIILIILSLLLLICCLRHRTKNLGTIDLPAIDELDGSPTIKKRSPKSSPKRLNGHAVSKSDDSLSNTELQLYGAEPRRPGSRSPPPADTIIKESQLNLISSTYR